jgi:hypothetical protein
MLRAAALTLTCALLALTAAACGESASGGDADPASLVPAGTPMYFEAAVQPTGDRRENALAAAGKVLRTDDPAGKLRELINKALADEDSGLTWEKDFAPWLGEDAGVWVSNLEAAEPSFAAIVAIKDAEAAGAALGRFKQSGDETWTKRSYEGIDYEVSSSEGNAVGIVDDFLVAATEDAFKRTVDMRDGGESLADSDRYKDAVGDVGEESLGHYYADTRTIFDLALAEDPEAAAQLEQFKGYLPFDKLGPITGSFEADGEGMALDTVLTGVPEGPFRQLAGLWAGGETELLGDLPGNAWMAFAAPKLGEGAKTLFDSFAGALGGAAIAAQVKQATGLDLEADVFSWVGDTGFYVRGESEADLDGAVVIESTDDAKAEIAFGKLIGLIGKEAGAQPEPIELEGAASAFALEAGAGKPVVLARGQGRIVAAFGEAAATDALQPDAQLGDSDLYGEAEEVLGDDFAPSFLLSMPAVIKLVEATGQADADFEEARPYLEAFGSITSGGKADGDRVESRVAVSLK